MNIILLILQKININLACQAKDSVEWNQKPANT